MRRWSSVYAVRLLETAGLDVVYDGEQQRNEMYAWAVAHSGGFEWRGSVRAFDNRYDAKAAVTKPPWLRTPWYTHELELLRQTTHAAVKVPITGAYTIADWSFDEYYDTGTDLSIPVAGSCGSRSPPSRPTVASGTVASGRLVSTGTSTPRSTKCFLGVAAPDRESVLRATSGRGEP